ncbi:MAG: hypothetical protein GOU98_01520 [Candidatus Altiarchaeota archaeon]|nr:hypothetical protein [Candidatus Altiarchaeota archaeon]
MAKNGFSFNMPDGTNFGYAKNLNEFKKMLKVAPRTCVEFHHKKGDFANWVKYMGHSDKARKIKTIKSTSNLVTSIDKALSATKKKTVKSRKVRKSRATGKKKKK